MFLARKFSVAEMKLGRYTRKKLMTDMLTLSRPDLYKGTCFNQCFYRNFLVAIFVKQSGALRYQIMPGRSACLNVMSRVGTDKLKM